MSSPRDSTYIGETVMPKRDKKPRYWVKQSGNKFAVYFADRQVRGTFTSRFSATMWAESANKMLNDPTSNSED